MFLICEFADLYKRFCRVAGLLLNDHMHAVVTMIMIVRSGLIHVWRDQ